MSFNKYFGKCRACRTTDLAVNKPWATHCILCNYRDETRRMTCHGQDCNNIVNRPIDGKPIAYCSDACKTKTLRCKKNECSNELTFLFGSMLVCSVSCQNDMLEELQKGTNLYYLNKTK
jgi:hypothetical protein